MGLAERLVNYRLENKVTQQALADLLEIDKKEVEAMELENRKPEAKTLIKLAKLLKVSLDDLMFDEGFEEVKETITEEVIKEVVEEPENNEKISVYDYSNNRIGFEEKVDIINNASKTFKDIDEVFLIQNPDTQGKNRPLYILTGFNHRKFLSAVEYELAYYADLDDALKEMKELRNAKKEYTIKYASKVKNTMFGIRLKK